MMNQRAEELSLRAIQQWFLSVTTHPESAQLGVMDQAKVVPPTDLPRVVRGRAGASALDGLEIYHQSYFSRLEECLADDYPALKFAIGGSAFEDLCRAYTLAHPSRSPNLNGFGSRLPSFIEQDAAKWGRFVAELSRLEWAIVEVLHAPASQGFSAERLATIPAERLADVRFTPNPALRMLSFEYPINRFFQAFLDGEEPAVPESVPSSVVVIRSGYRIRRLDLRQSQATLLRRLIAGEPLGAALAGVTTDQEAIESWFREWTSHGVFDRTEVDEASE
jgi:hypothetical protein